MSDAATILIVDDEALNRMLLRSVLEEEGYRVLEAPDGEQALQLTEEHAVDLILLDVVMPGIDGIEVCRRVRQKEQLAHVPIILLTALDDSATRTQGSAAGCDDFLSKPVDDSELFARLSGLLDGRSALGEETR